MGLDKYRIYTDYDSSIIGLHRNYLLPDEGSNKVFKPDLDMASKPYLDIIKCNKYLFNDPFNININTPSSDFKFKYYGTPINLPKDRKEIQPVEISQNEGNRSD